MRYKYRMFLLIVMLIISGCSRSLVKQDYLQVPDEYEYQELDKLDVRQYQVVGEEIGKVNLKYARYLGNGHYLKSHSENYDILLVTPEEFMKVIALEELSQSRKIIIMRQGDIIASQVDMINNTNKRLQIERESRIEVTKDYNRIAKNYEKELQNQGFWKNTTYIFGGSTLFLLIVNVVIVGVN